MQQVDGFGATNVHFAPNARSSSRPGENCLAQAFVKTAGTEVRFTSQVVSRVPSRVDIYKYRELSLKGVAFVQSGSGGDDGTRIGEMEFKDC